MKRQWRFAAIAFYIRGHPVLHFNTHFVLRLQSWKTSSILPLKLSYRRLTFQSKFSKFMCTRWRFFFSFKYICISLPDAARCNLKGCSSCRCTRGRLKTPKIQGSLIFEVLSLEKHQYEYEAASNLKYGLITVQYLFIF